MGCSPCCRPYCCMLAGEETFMSVLVTISCTYCSVLGEPQACVSPKKLNGIRQRVKQWKSTVTGGHMLDEATFTIRTLRVLVHNDSSVLDDRTPHVINKPDIMLIQSEAPFTLPLQALEHQYAPSLCCVKGNKPTWGVCADPPLRRLKR